MATTTTAQVPDQDLVLAGLHDYAAWLLTQLQQAVDLAADLAAQNVALREMADREFRARVRAERTLTERSAR
jgi:hypothetical protein